MKKNTTLKQAQKYDIAFIDPCFEKVIEAITLQKNGQKVLLVFQNQMNRNDSFQLTKTFPYNVFQIFKSTRKSRMLKKMFLLCPHLIQPQKIILMKSGNLKTFALLIDFLFRNQLKEKSTVLNQKISENLSFLKVRSLQGIVFQEYKINVSRLFIELLKSFETIGGKIEVKKHFDEKEISTIIHCKSQNRINFLSSIKCPSNFALETKTNNIRYRLLENNNLLSIDFSHSKTKDYTKDEIQKEVEKIVDLNSQSIKKIRHSIFLTTKTISNILKTIKSPLPGSFPNAEVKDNYELSLEKFDVAKQTGITYPEFKILFHRYGSGIDEMIDEAYEKMNKTRDPQKIWSEVEDWFQRKYEWKVE